MATSLMTQPCCDVCDQDAEYLVSFVISSLEMTDAEQGDLCSEILMVVAWDRNVMKLIKKSEVDEEFDKNYEITILATPNEFSKKLKKNPIMLNISRGCTELGTAKLELSDCFTDAVLCDEFNSQTVVKDYTFVLDEQENAKMKAYFRVQKLLDDGLMGKVFKDLKDKKKKRLKKDRHGSDDDSDDTSDEGGKCRDFACPDELAAKCMMELGLDKFCYRIVNGNLVNVKDRSGPCGEECRTGAKLTKEISNVPVDEPIFSTRFNFAECSARCEDVFKESDGSCVSSKRKEFQNFCSQLTSNPSTSPSTPVTRKPCKDDWIDRNIKEEDLLIKLCEKYKVKVDDLKDEVPDDCLKDRKIKKAKKVKKTKVKCRKRVGVNRTACQVSPCE